MNKRRRHRAKARRKVQSEDQWMQSLGCDRITRESFRSISHTTNIPLRILLRKP